MIKPEVTFEMPPPYRKQREAIWDSARFSVIEASSKAGKTVGSLCWLFEKAINSRSGRNFWWVAPVFGQTEIAYFRLKNMLIEGDPHRTAWKENNSKLTITLVNGNTLHFKSADQPDNLFGEDVYAAVLDEATRMREEAWHAVRSTLTATRGPIRIIGNVKGRKNWVHRLAVQAKGGLEDHAYHKITCWDAVEAGILDIAEIELARQQLPPNVFKELYEAEPADDGGNPFGLSNIDRQLRGEVESFPYMTDSEPFVFGVDLAKATDWTVVVGLDEDGNVCQYHRWQASWTETEARVLPIIGGCPTLVDSTGVGDPIVERWRLTNPNITPFVFSMQSRQRLMEGLAMAIHQSRVWFPEGQMANELRLFEYIIGKQGQVKYAAPEKCHDDSVMALALAVYHKQHATGFSVDVVGGAPKADEVTETVFGTFKRLRADPDWGWN